MAASAAGGLDNEQEAIRCVFMATILIKLLVRPSSGGGAFYCFFTINTRNALLSLTIESRGREEERRRDANATHPVLFNQGRGSSLLLLSLDTGGR